MKTKFNKILAKLNVNILSSFAAFALVITTFASNQRCWFVLHEEKLPENCEKLRKF